MAVKCSEMITTAAGKKRADALAALVPDDGWQRLSCADGSKGPRVYDWALIAAKSPQYHLLARRSLQPDEKGVLELAFFRCWSPRPVTLPELAAVAGARWGVEDCFGEAKNEAGLDHYQVRKYRAWYRHATLAMLAHAFLAIAARASRPGTPAPQRASASGAAEKGTCPCGQPFAPPRTYAPPPFITGENGRDLIPLTAAEARRLFNLHVHVPRPRAFREQWSHWRRYRQAAARKSHYARRTRSGGTLLSALADPAGSGAAAGRRVRGNGCPRRG